MVCTEIIGKIKDIDTTGKKINKVSVEWSDASKKIQRLTTDSGDEIGIHMDDSILVRGLYEGDVIYQDDDRIIVVETPPCEVINIYVDHDHPSLIAKVCYEIGNRHAPLFYGNDIYSFVTPYNEPMLVMLEKIHGVRCDKKMAKLDFEKRISTTVHHHTH